MDFARPFDPIPNLKQLEDIFFEHARGCDRKRYGWFWIWQKAKQGKQPVYDPARPANVYSA
jgi:hypothetical protein